jgi:hyperosmotically inducible periplasmic protein
MSFRLTALLCLTGAVVACSHNSETAKDPSYENQPAQASADPSMTPASLDSDGTARAGDTSLAPTTPSPSRTEAPADTRAPLVADTKGTGSTDYKSDTANTAPSNQPTSPGTQPDNTNVNERDRNAAALTPTDQRENQTDLKITQQIRQNVMDDSKLSFTAKNVKIITAGGKVTLRGPVKTAEERSAIEAAARKVAGVSQVDNQIEVKK